MAMWASAFGDFLRKVNDKVGGYLWAIFAAAIVLLIVILFIVIAAKNKRIKKLKKQLKTTRTELEIERTRRKNEQLFAPVTGGKQLFGQETAQEEEPILPAEEPDDETETTEVEEEPEPAPAPEPKRKPISAQDEAIERAASRVAYYNKTSVVSAKEGNVKFIVKYDRGKDSWVIKKEGVDRVVRRVDTKEEAMNVARALCKKYNANLVVHKKDGKFQKQ